MDVNQPPVGTGLQCGIGLAREGVEAVKPRVPHSYPHVVGLILDHGHCNYVKRTAVELELQRLESVIALVQLK